MSLDATVGTTTANSYVSAVESDAYFENRLHSSSSWASYASKDSALITASSMLDWYVKWKGIKTLDAQSMQWPRSDVTRPSAVAVADDIIPNEVKVAVYELAFASMVEDRVAESSLAGLNQVQAGPLMIKTDGGGYDSTKKESIPDHVYKILSDLTSTGGVGVVRLMRA
jgi:hypothetical protein